MGIFKTCPNSSPRSYDTKVVMKLTEQYDGHVLSLLEDAEDWNKKTDLTHSVVKIGIVRIKMERLSAFVHFKATVMVAINPDLISLEQIQLNWKEHIFHTGSSSNCKSILENGLWAGGSSPRSTRQTCFFSALNLKESSL